MIVDQRLAASGLEPWKQRLLKNLLELRVLGDAEKMYVWSGLDVWLVLRIKPDSTDKSFLSLKVPRFGDTHFEEAVIRRAKADFETIVQQGILEVLKLDEDLNGIAINWLQNFLSNCVHDLPPRGSTIAEHLQIFWQQRESDPDGLFAACVAALGVGG